MRTKPRVSWAGQQHNASSSNAPSPQIYAPPPGPPPQWQHWQTPHSSPPQTAQRNNTLRRGNGMNLPPPGSGSRTPIVSKEEEVRKLFKICEAGRGNARLLHEAIVYAKPEDLKENTLIDEFRARCRASQERIRPAIPWATTEAENSRRGGVIGAEATEERLLSELLASNEELLDALQLYDQLERIGAEQQERESREAERKLRALDAITSFEPTSLESSLVDQIFAIGDRSGSGSVSADAAYKIFTGSQLPPDILTSIWEIANVEENSTFGKHCVGVALRLVGHAQIGQTIKEELVNQVGPTATLAGLDTPSPLHNYNVAGPSGPSLSISTSTSSPFPASSSSILPPLTPQDRTKFIRIFAKSNPENNVLSGQRARELLMKSKLPMTTLGQIWELADTQHRGVLDAPAFIIAMYLVQACMSGQLSSIPPTLPPFLYAEAAQAFSSMSSSPTYPDVGGASSTQPWTPSMPVPSSNAHGAEWGVSLELKASADTFFDALDEQKKGFLDGEIARSHFLHSGLPQDTIRQIWDLADINLDGRLDREEFAIALYFIQMKQDGQILPQNLPANLVPPTLRSARSAITSLFPQPTSPSEESLIELEEPEQPIRMPVPNITITSAAHAPSFPSPTDSRPPLPFAMPHSTSMQTPVLDRSLSMSSPFAGSPSMSTPGSSSTTTEWEISPAESANSDRLFDTVLDPWKHGYIEGDVAVAFLSKSKLDPEVLARIWNLADIDDDGRLTKDEFAVAMYLVRRKLSGDEIPSTLPASLVLRRPTPDSADISETQADVTTPTVAANPTVSAELSRVYTPPPPYQENIPAEVEG